MPLKVVVQCGATEHCRPVQVPVDASCPEVTKIPPESSPPEPVAPSSPVMDASVPDGSPARAAVPLPLHPPEAASKTATDVAKAA